MRAVARLYLDHGLSLTACAERLSISRETVRVHLRRLRALQRRAAARTAARDRFEAHEDGGLGRACDAEPRSEDAASSLERASELIRALFTEPLDDEPPLTPQGEA